MEVVIMQHNREEIIDIKKPFLDHHHHHHHHYNFDEHDEVEAEAPPEETTDVQVTGTPRQHVTTAEEANGTINTDYDEKEASLRSTSRDTYDNSDMSSVVKQTTHHVLESPTNVYFDNKQEFEDECGLDLGFEKKPEILAIENAVKVLLQGLGEDVNREGIRKTPLRVAKALREGTKGYRMKAQDIVDGALFPEAGLESGVGHAGGMGGLVIVRDLDFFSYCEACLLPFQVKCHVGYVPCGQVVVGLSKLSRVVDTFAKRLQDPHRLADEVCKSLHDGIKPAGVAVVLQCFHIHSPKIGSTFLDVNDHGWTKTLITSGSGVFEDKKANDWSDFLSLLKFKTKNPANDAGGVNGSLDKCWCPLNYSFKTNPVDPAMMTVVASIIQYLGEDPLREELIGTPARFVTWLMNFKKCNLEMKLNGGLVLNGTVSHGEEHICSELNLSFLSQCEHHLLPFYGVVHIGYLSSKVVNPIGRSVLHSIVHFYGFKLQVQERLTKQVAETVSSLLGKDVMVVVEAGHTCMISRGIEKFGSNTATFAVLGRFSSNPALRTKFLQSIPSFCKTEG